MVMMRLPAATLLVLAAVSIVGCASAGYRLMPTPELYRSPGAVPLLAEPGEVRGGSTDVDLLFITDRAAATASEAELPYGETRASAIAFGFARVEFGAGVSWEDLERESRAEDRTRELILSLGRVEEFGRFPDEPYRVEFRADGNVYRNDVDLQAHNRAARLLRDEVQQRLVRSPTNDVTLYVHGFNETFASAAFTAAELCHFLGREPVCAFFTWPASRSGNVVTSYSRTTESAQYSVDHLKQIIRLLATTPGVERLQLLAHSRGAGLLMKAVRDLFLETFAAGKEPIKTLRIDNLVLFSPDIDIDVAKQDMTLGVSDPDMFTSWPGPRLPRSLGGRLTIYSSPQDRALLVSRIVFRSQGRAGNLRAEDVPMDLQRFLAPFDKVDFIIHEGRRTDSYGHFYFTSNPRVSSDLIQLLRFDKRPGDPGRELTRVGPIVWRFPASDD